MTSSKSMLAAITAAFAMSAGVPAGAADASTDRTHMPDFCSNRDVTCVLPDGGGGAAPRPNVGAGGTGLSGNAPPGATLSGSGTASQPNVVVTPAIPSGVPSGTTTATPTVPSAGQVPAPPGQIRSGPTVPNTTDTSVGATGGTSGGTSSNASGGTTGGIGTGTSSGTGGSAGRSSEGSKGGGTGGGAARGR